MNCGCITGFPVTPEAIAAGVRCTSWPGRLERVQNRGREWILDVAHNPAGAWALRAGLRDALGPDEARPMTLVFACLRDKPLAELAQILFPLFEQVVFPPIQSPRATPVEELLAAARSTGTPALVAGSVADALDLAAKRPGSGAVRDFSPGTTSVTEGVGRDFTPGAISVTEGVGRDFTPGTISVTEGVGRDFSPGTTVVESRGPLGPEVCLAAPEGTSFVVISGSVYLVGEARGLLMSSIEHKQEAPA